MTSPLPPDPSQGQPDIGAILAQLGAGQPQPASQPPDDPEQMIRQALDQIQLALASDGFTEQERLTMAKVHALLQGLPAGREKEQQAALGGGPATNFLSRTVGA